MSNIILNPSRIQSCAAATIARGLRWDGATGALVAGTGKDLSYISRLFDRILVARTTQYDSRAFIDFHIPVNFIDFTRYNITSVDIKFYNTFLLSSIAVLMEIYDRTGLLSNRKIQLIPTSEDSSLWSSLGSTKLGEVNISSINNYYSINTTNSTFINNLKNSYLTNNLVSICLRDKLEANAPAVSASIAEFVMWNDDSAYLPQMIVNYELIQSPATIVSFSPAAQRTKYNSLVSCNINTQDTESDTAVIQVEGSFGLSGGTMGDYISIHTASGIMSSPSGTISSISVPASSYMRTSNLAYAQDKWLYDQAIGYLGGAPNPTYSSFVSAWSVPAGKGLYTTYSGGRLKADSTYNVAASCSMNTGRLRLLRNGTTFFTSSTSLTPSGSFIPEDDDITIILENTGGSTISTSEFSLTEYNNINAYYEGLFRARAIDNDGSGAYTYFTQSIKIDNRIPTDVVISESHSTNEVFHHVTPTGTYSWTPATLSGVGISGYYVRFGANKIPELSSADIFVPSGQHNYSVVAPFEGKWYFSVSPIGSNGVIGNTSSYGFFYNSPEEFLVASGVKVNNININSSDFTWVSKLNSTTFQWSAPAPKLGNNYSYTLECSISGGVSGKELVYPVNWDLLPTGQTKGYFGLQIKDSAGFTYINKTTELEENKWSYYTAASGWAPFSITPELGLPRASGITQVKYVLDKNDQLPEKASLHPYFKIGYFDASGGGTFRYSQPTVIAPIIFNQDNIGYGNVLPSGTLGYSGQVGLLLQLTVSGVDTTYRSSNNPRGFNYMISGNGWYEMPTPYLAASGTVKYGITICPYMSLPSGIVVGYKWKYVKNGVDDSSWVGSGNFVAANPDIGYDWELVDPEISVSGIQNPIYIHGKSMNNTSTSYYMRVRVFDGFEQNDWSPTYKFRVNTPPDPPTNLRVS